MKTASFVAGLILLFGPTLRAFGLAGDLKQPGVAFPAGFPESVRTNVMAALRPPLGEFRGGRFVNSSTNLRYAGDAVALNRFLEVLVKCPGARVSVRFQKEGILEGDDWTVSHDADQPYRFTVRVNLESSRVKLDGLVIPELNGPPIPGGGVGSRHGRAVDDQGPPPLPQVALSERRVGVVDEAPMDLFQPFDGSGAAGLAVGAGFIGWRWSA